MAGNGKQISSGRAQDWISSVLNPIIDGLRREQGLLAAGTWHWLQNTGRFEYLHPYAAYVAEIYRGNLDDFLAKHSKVEDELVDRDAALEQLRRAVADAFARLTGPEGREVEAAMCGDLPERSRIWSYFASYIASGLSELPVGAYAEAERFNEAADARGRAAVLIRAERKRAQGAAKRLKERNAGLLERLTRLRTELADRYGARIVPVEY